MFSLHSLSNLLYPPVCLLCRKTPEFEAGRAPRALPYCAHCYASIQRCEKPICRQCGISIAAAYDALVRCRQCQAAARAFSRACAPWAYTAPLQKAVHAFKYAQRWRIGEWLAQEMATTAKETLPLETVSLIVPIPYFWLQQRLRGFDATAFLAKKVSKLLAIPLSTKALSRTRWTRSQTRLTWPGRLRNTRGAFQAKALVVSGRNILLIDDVLTSGATAENAALALRKAGAAEVFVLAAARTPLN